MDNLEEYDCEQAKELVIKWSPLIIGRTFNIGQTAFTYTSVESHNIEQREKCYVVVLSTHTALYLDLRKVIFDDPYLMAIYSGLQGS